MTRPHLVVVAYSHWLPLTFKKKRDKHGCPLRSWTAWQYTGIWKGTEVWHSQGEACYGSLFHKILLPREKKCELRGHSFPTRCCSRPIMRGPVIWVLAPLEAHTGEKWVKSKEGEHDPSEQGQCQPGTQLGSRPLLWEKRQRLPKWPGGWDGGMDSRECFLLSHCLNFHGTGHYNGSGQTKWSRLRNRWKLFPRQNEMCLKI